MNSLVKTLLLLIAVFAFAFCLSSPVMAARPIEFGINATKAKIGEGFGYNTWSAGQHSIASLANTVYSAWAGYGLLFGISEDGGNTWGATEVVVSSGTSISLDVSPNGLVHAAYEGGNDVKYTRRATNGTWSTPVSITNSLSGGSAAIVVSGNNNIHVGWHSGSDVYHSKSTDGGYNWDTPVKVNSSTGGDYPSIAVDSSGNVYMTWLNWTSDQIYVSKYNGYSWSSQVAVNGSEGFAFFPSIAADGSGNVYVAWPSDVAGIVVASSYNGGASWNTPVVFDTSYGWDDVSIAVSPNGDVNVAYESVDTTGCSASSDRSVFMARSTNSGSSFETPVFVSCDGFTPNLTVDSNNRALIMWGGWSPTVKAIFFSREL